MRRVVTGLIVTMAMLLPARADPPIPSLTGRVVDQADILDTGAANALSRQLSDFEQSTGDQIVVVTLRDLKGYPIEDWGLALGRGWGIGQKGKNNGALLIVAPNDRRVRIEVGYGLEGQLPDATANEIIQSEIIPRFKAGDMQGGVQSGVNGILAALQGAYTPSKLAHASGGNALQPFIPFVAFPLIFFLVVLINIRRGAGNPQSGYGGRTYYGGYGGGGFSSGGGGFSGGGGSFGGGGASGRW